MPNTVPRDPRLDAVPPRFVRKKVAPWFLQLIAVDGHSLAIALKLRFTSPSPGGGGSVRMSKANADRGGVKPYNWSRHQSDAPPRKSCGPTPRHTNASCGARSRRFRWKA